VRYGTDDQYKERDVYAPFMYLFFTVFRRISAFETYWFCCIERRKQYATRVDASSVRHPFFARICFVIGNAQKSNYLYLCLKEKR
jgi:hypothetical protein